MKLNQFIILSLLYLIEQMATDNSISIEPKPATPIHDEPINAGLWEALRPWRGIAMICFWSILIGICLSYIIVRYCCKQNGHKIKKLLRRGKYSNYNFVSVYSETEAEQLGALYSATEDECDNNNNNNKNINNNNNNN
eukprot:3011_1